MPAFAGSLRHYPLVEVLRTIEARQMTGRLLLRYEGLDAVIYFAHGQWLLAERPGEAVPLAVLLAQAGYITPQLFEMALGVPFSEAASVSDEQTASLLVAARVLGQEQLRAWALRDAQDLIENVQRLPGGDFAFEEGITPPPARYGLPLPLAMLLPAAPGAPWSSAPGQPYAPNAPSARGWAAGPASGMAPETASYAMGIAELERPLRPLTPEALIAFPEIDRQTGGALRLTREQWRVLTMVDGQTSPRAVAMNLQVPEPVVMRILAELVNGGIVVVV